MAWCICVCCGTAHKWVPVGRLKRVCGRHEWDKVKSRVACVGKHHLTPLIRPGNVAPRWITPRVAADINYIFRRVAETAAPGAAKIMFGAFDSWRWQPTRTSCLFAGVCGGTVNELVPFVQYLQILIRRSMRLYTPTLWPRVGSNCVVSHKTLAKSC
jgi:hypothetical protein